MRNQKTKEQMHQLAEWARQYLADNCLQRLARFARVNVWRDNFHWPNVVQAEFTLELLFESPKQFVTTSFQVHDREEWLADDEMVAAVLKERTNAALFDAKALLLETIVPDVLNCPVMAELADEVPA